ncbi:MAG: M23 family metallopeptidase [Bryobacteraceae bacterium]
MKKFCSFVVFVSFLGLVALYVASSSTEVQLDPPVTALGMESPIRVKLVNPHGVRRLAAFVEQEGARHQVFDVQKPANRLTFWREDEQPLTMSFVAGKNQAPALQDGKARLIIEATSNDLRARTTTMVQDVDVVTRPPALTVDAAQHYINQGGAELVTFSVSGYWTEAGVRVGKYEFRSFPLPGSQSERFSLFAFPWDVPADTVPVVFARNPGTETTSRFWHKVFPKRFRARDLELPDSFLEKVVNELDPGGSGELIDRFLRINGPMRHENNQRLADLRAQTEERFLWSGPFLQLANSKVESQFADTRSYIYNGRKVDQQTHLGFDLSVVKNVPVSASNDGKVILAEYLGIYGNCIVIDHGYGLQSIYAHLSQIGAKPGDMVKKGQEIGRSGATGLAGGDHLHFSMQIDGVQVNPVEWWDGHWIQDRILSKLPKQ